VKKGFFNDAYQVGIAGVVKIDPTKPASSQTNMVASNPRMERALDLFTFPATTSESFTLDHNDFLCYG
jgi:hypothetical protein